jgi:DNA-binding FadR family transcriptional regulator
MEPPPPRPSAASLFAPVRSLTSLDATLERLNTAIRLRLLEPGERLPAQRELCRLLRVSRSTLREALASLAESGHLTARRGRGGGTFVSENLPAVSVPALDGADWRETWDRRLGVELAVAVRAVTHASPAAVDRLEWLRRDMQGITPDRAAFLLADARWHLALAQACSSGPLLSAMTEVQGRISNLIPDAACSPALLDRTLGQHQRLAAALRRRDADSAEELMVEHLRETERLLEARR